MAVVSGFFNSVSGDRKYNAEHFGRFFDGLICDGVYVNYPEKKSDGTYTEANERGFYVSPGTGVAVNVAPGRCFFDHCWMYTDAIEVISLASLAPSNALSKKIIAIFIDVDTSQETRLVTLKAVAGTEVANDDQHTADPPAPIITATHKQYPIALIAMNGTVSAISASNIYRFDASYSDYRRNYFARTKSVEALLEYSSRTKEEIGERIGKIEVPTFTEASVLANINSGENINTLWGKIKKSFNKILFGTGATAGQVWKVQNNGQADWQNDWGVVTRNGAGLAPVIPAAAEGKQRYLDEFGQWTEPVGTNTNAETVGNVKIGVSGGKYGYWDGNTFKTFRQPTGNAGVGDVRSGVTFANANSDALIGTFAAQEKTVTGSRSAQTVTPDSGKYLSKVTVNKYPDASGTFKPTVNASNVDMGATNNYRYVNTIDICSAAYHDGQAATFGEYITLQSTNQNTIVFFIMDVACVSNIRFSGMGEGSVEVGIVSNADKFKVGQNYGQFTWLNGTWTVNCASSSSQWDFTRSLMQQNENNHYLAIRSRGYANAKFIMDITRSARPVYY